MVNDSNEIKPTDKLKDLFNTPNEKAALQTICKEILSSLNLTTPPIPLKPICHKFNLIVKYNNVQKKEDSFLKLAPNGFEIELSREKHWRRNRFTIAHELSHLILYKTINRPINSFDKTQHDYIERLCDFGASELLISESELEKALIEYGLNNDGLKKIYDRFLISYDALFLKLSDFLNANIVIWKNYARHELDTKEYRVFRHFPKYRDAIKQTWLPNGLTSKHIKPFVFAQTEEFGHNINENLKILMGSKVTNCQSITFIFPHSRVLTQNLPIFDDLIVSDESIYDDCFIMFIFNDKQKFNKIVKKYCHA